MKDNGIDLRTERGELGFAAALTNVDYDTALIGKAHFATTQTFSPQSTVGVKLVQRNMLQIGMAHIWALTC